MSEMSKEQVLEWLDIEKSLTIINDMTAKGENPTEYILEALRVAKNCVKECIERESGIGSRVNRIQPHIDISIPKRSEK